MGSLLYRYPVESLFTGSSLGNFFTFARLSRETDLKGLWSALDNQFYVGEWTIELKLEDDLLEPTETFFRPESQTTVYCKKDQLVEKQFFIPFQRDNEALVQPSILQSAIYLIRYTNTLHAPVRWVIRHTLTFPAVPSEKFTKQPPVEQTSKLVEIIEREHHCEVTTLGTPAEARIFGSTAKWMRCGSNDKGLTADYSYTVNPGETMEIPFVVAYSPQGVVEASRVFSLCMESRRVLDESVSVYREILSRTEIFTPEPVINRGLQWAKVNSVRVQHQYRLGSGFSNDPPQDIIVVRDLAWYALGSDYVTPEFSKDLLELGERCAFHDDGKLTEYIHGNESPPAKHDYKLNINDDTPLFVAACFHHALTVGAEFTFERAYPSMRRACDYIISQIEDGLVRCHAEGTNVWGICGWRNIVDNYNLTGAVTEVNAECYYALASTASTAHSLGRLGDAERYRSAAERLKSAINSKLISEDTGLYLLNLDNRNVPHADITGDLIFPVMFGVAESPMRERILDKLTDDDMWTPYGSRTVSKFERNYDPDSGCQLMGGLWPNLTAWTAYCIRRQNPEKLVEGMVNIYKLCEPERPVDFVNVVPGEFPERIHGETFVSRGMAMSPWMPPTYLWLGVEGLLGLTCSLEVGTEVNPSIPHEWTWIAVKRLLVQGQQVTAFVYEDCIYSTHPVKSSMPVQLGTLLECECKVNQMFTIALKVGKELLVFAATDREAKDTLTVRDGTHTVRREISLDRGEAVLLRVNSQAEVASSTGSIEYK
ncbi:MAG TPA: hypothetical protein VGR15_08670 [Bacteroidota bacterium]|jgi:glycogen debranching enzyme|nr:hypothetical protein [Bacteroidota bacterium]